MNDRRGSATIRLALNLTIVLTISTTFLISLAFPIPAYADILRVNTTDDTDDGLCDPSHCSLREAINASNASPGPDTIGFDTLSGVPDIRLSSPLPALTDNGTFIDGTTMPGYAGTPIVHIMPDGMVINIGLDIQSDDNILYGLTLTGFGTDTAVPWPTPSDVTGGAVVVSGSGNLIRNCVLGLGMPNSIGAHLVGGSNTLLDNTISSNVFGVVIDGAYQTLQGNRIGTDPAGTNAMANFEGILDSASSGGHHVIGGPNPGEGNIISGNSNNGIILNSAHNRVQGNLIGTNAAGTAALPNAEGLILGGPYGYIGGPNPGEGNLISGNNYAGIRTTGINDGTIILGNIVGADINGTYAIPNAGGVNVFGINLTIGGPDPVYGNLFFGNLGEAIRMNYQSETTSIGSNTFTQNGEGIRLNLGSGEGGFTFSRNSIYDNAGLGIYIQQWETITPSVAPPDLLSASTHTITGTTCPDCTVELFIADPDPSGAGEGKSFLGEALADSNGDFTAQVDIGYCQEVTATSTNLLGNTSQFAQNITGHCFKLGPLYLIPIWSFIIVVFGMLGRILRQRYPDRPGMVPGGLLVGAIFGAGLLFGVGLLPGVETELFSGDAQFTAAPLPCEAYLNPDGYSPAAGEQLARSPDITLAWTPEEGAPDDVRWQVHLSSFGGGHVEAMTEETSITFTELGITPRPGNTYAWEVHGERPGEDGETWEPFCSAGNTLTFTILQEGAEPEEDAGDEPPGAEEACTPTATALMNLTCRYGPATEYEELGYLLEGESAVIEGQNAEGTWWYIPNPDWQGSCWIWGGGVEAECTDDVRTLIPPPLPTEEAVCRPDLDRTACNEAGGVFIASEPPMCECP